MSLSQAASKLWTLLFDLELKFVRWWGPVASAIKGEVTKEERHRVIAKAIVTYGVSWAGLKHTLADASVVAEFLVPVVIAAWAARVEYVARREHGGEEPTNVSAP